MASTPKVTNYQHSEIPPWKIELIQRKRRHQGTISPNIINGNSGIRSIAQPESDVNTGKCSTHILLFIKAKKLNRSANDSAANLNMVWILDVCIKCQPFF